MAKRQFEMEVSSSEELTDIGTRVANAAKWSTVTQLASKLISPVTTVVLARLLTPASFGIVASATMITSLADVVTDAGFQKYLIQHRFENGEELSLASCVAFWSNLVVSLAAVCCVAAWREGLAELLGNEGWGNLLALSALSIPLSSLSSVQTALYQRRYDFKTLFTSRVGSSLLVLIVSVVLAFLDLGPWSMVAGTLVSNLFLAAWLTMQSPWKPTLQYDFATLRAMLRFGLWILAESLAIWINTWAGTFIIGRLMDQTHVGLYKTSTAMTNSVMNVITAAVLPVVFVALSETQSDRIRFKRIFLKTQQYLAFGVIPIGFGILVFHELATLVLLGDQWMETALYFGLWTGANCVVIVIGYMGSEAYRALGRPQVCVVIQVTYLVPFLPALWISADASYQTLTAVMPLVRLTLLFMHIPLLKRLADITLGEMIGNLRWILLAVLVAMIPGMIITYVSENIAQQALAAVVSVTIYIFFALLQPDMRSLVVGMLEKFGMGHISRLLDRREA